MNPIHHGNAPPRTLRPSGLDSVGDLPWGTHLCQFYETPEDLLDIVVPFIRAGLEAGEMCLWVVANPIPARLAANSNMRDLPRPLFERQLPLQYSAGAAVEGARAALLRELPDAERHLHRGDIEIIPYHQFYLRDGHFAPDDVIAAWREKQQDALARGYAGMRIHGTGAWLSDTDWPDFVRFQRQVNDAVAQSPTIVLCTYPLANNAASHIFDLAEVHHYAIAKRHGHCDILETSKLKHAKEELVCLKETLERRVRERTEELEETNRRLRAEIEERRRAESALREGKEALREREAALRESEDLYRFLAENTNDVVTLHRLDGTPVHVSPSQARLGGHTAERAMSGVHPDDLPAVQTAWERVTRGETAKTIFRNRHSDGSWRWLESHGRRVEYRGVPHIMAVTRDITAAKQATEQLEASEHRYRTLLDTAPTGIFINVDGRFAYVNAALCRLLGATAPGDLLGKEVLQFVHPSSRASVLQRIARVKATGEPAPLMHQHYVRLDGAVVDVETTAVPTEFGGRPAMQVVITDISGRCKAERALRESEARFAELADTIDEVFWIADARNDQVIYISPAYEKIWGRHSAGIFKDRRAWLEAIHPEDRARVHAANASVATGGRYDEEYRIIRPDGELRWIHDHGFPVRNADGQLERIVGVAQDITARRQLEEQLRQSQKMEAIGQLAGGVAHDFNNILSAIMLQAELSGDLEHAPAPIKEDLLQIRLAAERAAALTRQLLLFSSKQVMQHVDLDMNCVVSSVVKMLGRILGENIHIALRLSPAPLPLRADAGMLDQILLNLAVNSRDAMPQGGRLTIETSEITLESEVTQHALTAASGRYVRLTVSDTGTGIPDDVKPRIFEPFFTTKPHGKGTGLGLATVYGIVKQHRGLIDVRAEVGAGTTFELLFPASNVAVPDRGPSRLKNVRGGTETILLVEDERAIRILARVILERSGYQVVDAADGEEARAVFQQHKSAVALLLTDLVLPGGMTGKELTTTLRAGAPGLRVVYMSGYSAEVAGKDLHLTPGHNFLQKPFSPEAMLTTIRHALDEQPAS